MADFVHTKSLGDRCAESLEELAFASVRQLAELMRKKDFHRWR